MKNVVAVSLEADFIEYEIVTKIKELLDSARQVSRRRRAADEPELEEEEGRGHGLVRPVPHLFHQAALVPVQGPCARQGPTRPAPGRGSEPTRVR